MKEFDKIIKDKLSDIDSPYAADTWASIQKALPKKKKRPYGLFFLSFVFIVVLSLPVIAYLNRKAGTVSPKNAQPTTTGEQMAVIDEQTQTSIALSSNGDAQSFKPSESALKNQEASASNPGTSLNATSAVKVNSNKISAQSADNNAIQSYPEVNTTSVSSNTVKDIPAALTHENNTILESQNENQNLLRQNNVQLAKITLPSTGRVFGTDQSHLFESVQMSMKKNASLPCPTFVRKQNLSFIEFYFANDYGIRNMSLKNSDKFAYMDKRENTEFPFFSYSAGTRFGIGWESGIAFKSGLDYTQINEKFIYTDPNSIQKKTITLIKYIYDSNFNVVDSTKTVEEVEIPGSNKIVNYNKYRFVDIPVLFQYTIPGKKRLSYSITAGPYINISFTQSGKILSEDNKNLLDISDKKIYKDNIGLSLYTALAINYQLTKTTQIVFEPNIRYIPNSISQLQNPIDQKYLIASIAAGFRYKI